MGEFVTEKECSKQTEIFEKSLERIEKNIDKAIESLQQTSQSNINILQETAQNHRADIKELFGKVNGVPDNIKWLTWGFRLLVGVVASGFLGMFYYILKVK